MVVSLPLNLRKNEKKIPDPTKMCIFVAEIVVMLPPKLVVNNNIY